jgi:hypothetical protein
MQTLGSADRYVIARESNVVHVDFHRPGSPPSCFPGAGALRALKAIENEAGDWPRSDLGPERRLRGTHGGRRM